jgi:hypothetical protein
MAETNVNTIRCERSIPCEQCMYYAHDFHKCAVPFLEDEDIPEEDKEYPENIK